MQGPEQSVKNVGWQRQEQAVDGVNKSRQGGEEDAVRMLAVMLLRGGMAASERRAGG